MTMETLPTAPAPTDARPTWTGRIRTAAITTAVLLLALPFVVVSLSLIAQLPGKLWPEDMATPTGVRDAAWSTPEFPGARIGKPVVINPTKGQWFGFLPPDLAVEAVYRLPFTEPAGWVIDFYLDQLPRLGWKLVRVERSAEATRLLFRRHEIGLWLTVPAPESGFVRDYTVRTGAFSGKTLYAPAPPDLHAGTTPDGEPDD